MKRNPNYCKGIIIAHGKSERLLAGHITSNLHLNMKIYAENNGKTSIQIDSLKNTLNNTQFKDKKSFKRNYIVEENNGKIINFLVMPIMDLDDTNEKGIKEYISGEMFRNHWLSPYIIPVWNKKNLDEVLLELKLINKLPNDREKGKIYRNLFPVNTGKLDKEQVQELMKKFEKSKNTNMEIMAKKCLEYLKLEDS